MGNGSLGRDYFNENTKKLLLNEYYKLIMDLNLHLKSVINHLTCKIHHQKAVFEIKGNILTVTCCCSGFEIQCLRTMVEILETELESRQN